MLRILIIGANSFIGRNFIHFSKNRSVEEISLFQNNPEDINFTLFDTVIHLAAIVHQSKNIPDSEYSKINTDLCIKVAKYAKNAGIKQFIFLSTVKVYGEPVQGMRTINEGTTCYPSDSYGKSKYEAEKALKQLEDGKFIVSIIRTPVVYGAGVRANMLSILKLIERFPVLPLGNIQNKRSITYVENLVGFIDRIIEKNASGVFIAMDENPISTTELVKYIAKFLDKKVVLVNIPKFLLKFGNLFFHEKLSKLFGSSEFDNHETLKKLNFKPPYSSEEGIEKMVLAYKVKSKG